MNSSDVNLWWIPSTTFKTIWFTRSPVLCISKVGLYSLINTPQTFELLPDRKQICNISSDVKPLPPVTFDTLVASFGCIAFKSILTRISFSFSVSLIRSSNTSSALLNFDQISFVSQMIWHQSLTKSSSKSETYEPYAPKRVIWFVISCIYDQDPTWVWVEGFESK